MEAELTVTAPANKQEFQPVSSWKFHLDPRRIDSLAYELDQNFNPVRGLMDTATILGNYTTDPVGTWKYLNSLDRPLLCQFPSPGMLRKSVSSLRFSSKSNRWHNAFGAFIKSPTVSKMRAWAKKQGWTKTKVTGAGFEIWSDANGIRRMKLKPASTQSGLGPGSRVPRVTIWDDLGRRVDGLGRLVKRISNAAHAPLADSPIN